MDGKQFQFRTRTVLLILAAVFLAFTGVLYNLQVVHGGYYLEQSTRKIANTETVQAARGEILDRYGRVLVSNRASYQVSLDTSLMGDIQGRNTTLLKLLAVCREQGVAWTDTLCISGEAPFSYTQARPFETLSADGTESPSQLARLVESLKLKDLPENPTAGQMVDALRAYFEVDGSVGEAEGRALVGVLYELALRSKDVARTSYVFARDVNIAFITAVKEGKLSGVKIDTVTVRQYETEYAAHLLGQVGPIYAEDWDRYKDKGYSMNDTVGKDGVEAAFEDLLRGTPGTRDIELNQSGKVVSENWHVNAETGEVEAPKPGNNVMLTADIKLQEVVEESLKRHVPGMTDETEGAACVVTDMTGGILAMASYPTFSPESYSRDYNALSADPLKPLFNRALQGLYAPGSTIKMAVAAGGLEEGVISTTEEILDTGRYKHYDRIEDQPMCWYYRQYGRTHGWENVSEAIRDSCNIYFYETGLRLGIEKIDTYAALFGLGQKTGLELYEEAGEMAGPATSAKHGQAWYEGDTMYAAIGQGNTKVTPIQLANYVSTLVNGGSHYATHLLKTVKSSDFSQVVEEYRPEIRDEINLDPANLAAVKKGMGMVASEGSAAVYFKDLGVTVGAKTGTAQVSRNSEANAILVAFAPYENPEIALSIVVEKGGSGTLVAAIAAEILDYYFSAKGAMEAAPAENALAR
ncbi:penicillin-binding transpeptidase domain-containing protein [Candidatus Pseudoscillospira sp. SGI.172]|uniref:penicillin-binding transpeptidase domain-containing protein n=1 Tax=Candidatus Pseudoscillospira sp. SGI.172 TaxID=3420582 RepID=UPI003CFD4E61